MSDATGIETASLSDVGRVRSGNEDYCAEFQRSDGVHLIVLADGMGGHRGGATASRLAVEAIGEIFASSSRDPETVLHEAFSCANDRVHRAALGDDQLRGMGTTAVSLMLSRDGVGWVGHVGDSRAYRIRDGIINPLTSDHSVVAELVRRELITAEEAAVHPRRNEILRSIGVEPEIRADVSAIDVRPGDRYLLCSDGLSGLLSDQEIAEITTRETPLRAVQMLVDSANRRGGPDNITVQIVSMPDVSMTDVVTAGVVPLDDAATAPRGRALQIAAAIAVAVGLLAAVAVGLL